MKSDSNLGDRARPRFIDGVYTYCDRWCERCRFRDRCRVYRDVRRMDEALAAGRDPAEIEDDDDDFEAAGPPSPEFLAAIEAANLMPTDAEVRESEREDRQRRRRTSAHPLTIASHEYADLCRSVVPALRQVIGTNDALIAAAFETIEHFSYMIAVKTARAVNGLHVPGLAAQHDDDDDDDDELDPVQTDGNGTAKLVRLVVAESRDAWEVLQQACAADDDIPRQMVRRLSALESAVAAAFPRAMQFVRSGWDDQRG
jgi:hypothetical protein